jgi:hypothetical protein
MTAIPLIQRLVAIAVSLILLLATVHLIRKHKLREQYALLWLIASIAILLLSAFGGIVDFLASFFNVSYSPTLPLVAGLLFALMVLLTQSVALSNQRDQSRDMAQQIALLEFRLKELEAREGDNLLNDG